MALPENIWDVASSFCILGEALLDIAQDVRLISEVHDRVCRPEAGVEYSTHIPVCMKIC